LRLQSTTKTLWAYSMSSSKSSILSTALRSCTQDLKETVGRLHRTTDQAEVVNEPHGAQQRDLKQGESADMTSLRKRRAQLRTPSLAGVLRGCSRTLRETSESLKHRQNERLKMQGLSREEILL